MLKRSNYIAVVILLAFASGCERGPLPTYRAGGKVVYCDGTPVAGGLVVFQVIDGPKPTSARGTIEPDGSFRLSTFKTGDGAIEGEHRAAIIPKALGPEVDRDEVRRLPPKSISGKFSDFNTSGLTFSVSRQPSQNNFEITVDRAE